MRNSYSPEFKAKVVREVLREDKTLSRSQQRMEFIRICYPSGATKRWPA